MLNGLYVLYWCVVCENKWAMRTSQRKNNGDKKNYRMWLNFTGFRIKFEAQLTFSTQKQEPTTIIKRAAWSGEREEDEREEEKEGERVKEWVKRASLTSIARVNRRKNNNNKNINDDNNKMYVKLIDSCNSNRKRFVFQ